MPVAAESMEVDALRLLHRRAIDGSSEIRSLLSRASVAGAPLSCGIDGQINLRSAKIVEVCEDRVVLAAEHVAPGRQRQLYFRFDLGGSRYFFAAEILKIDRKQLEIVLPPAIHEAERRTLPRFPTHTVQDVSVEPVVGDGACRGRLVDESREGAGVLVPSENVFAAGSQLRLSFSGSSPVRESARLYGVVRNVHSTRRWRRLGLAVSEVPFGPEVPVERRGRILDGSFSARAAREFRLLKASLGAASARAGIAIGIEPDQPPIEVVRFANNVGREIVAIADRFGSGRLELAVVVAPAWGRTKETMLPLAAVLRDTLARIGKSGVVLRFDGTNRRGESWIDPECREPGDEYLRFRFSQAVEDIRSTVQFVTEDPRFQARRVVLVTASLASVEGRRAVATDRGERICGWISLVGMADLHSALRAASGGVDFAFGLERGIRFGRHELAGVVADMDLTGGDVLENRLGLLEDARRDMSKIQVPVTWIHGRNDGWIQLGQVRHLMSVGPPALRRLIEVPTGHQLRSSREALETFQLVATEVVRVAYKQDVAPVVPEGRSLAARQRAERARRPVSDVDLHEFWRKYMLGRSGKLGFELLSSTQAYQGLMAAQIGMLELHSGNVVADLGAGLGDFALALGKHRAAVRISEVDFLSEALRRGLERGRDSEKSDAVVADFDSGAIPFADSTFDRVLLSLLLGYLKQPERFLREVWRILRPGGRVVLSTPRRDADLSAIYQASVRELSPVRVRDLFGADAEREFSTLQREMMNEGAHLLALEEDGHFNFWDPDELADLVADAGFSQVQRSWAFGEPPQVALVAAVRS